MVLIVAGDVSDTNTIAIVVVENITDTTICIAIQEAASPVTVVVRNIIQVAPVRVLAPQALL